MRRVYRLTGIGKRVSPNRKQYRCVADTHIVANTLIFVLHDLQYRTLWTESFFNGTWITCPLNDVIEITLSLSLLSAVHEISIPVVKQHLIR